MRRVLILLQIGHDCWVLGGIDSRIDLDCTIATRGIRGGMVVLEGRKVSWFGAFLKSKFEARNIRHNIILVDRS